MGMPSGASGMPPAAVEMMQTLFRGWFTDAVASTFVVAVVLAAGGGLCALALRSARAARAAEQGEEPAGGESPAAAEGTL
jgi:hypothetical protein